MKKKIIYISGEGHSGSTLLDILLGSQTNAFSAGELSNLPLKGIKNREFCSCGKQVPECEVWADIIEEWERKCILGLEKYIQIQQHLASNKKIISSYRLLKNPTGDISSYLKDTYELYNCIFKTTDSDIIIDSSKAPNKILILKKIGFEVTVVHLIRRFGDVLNSYKKSAKKDLEAGIEHDLVPQKTWYILIVWILKNLLTILFSRGVTYRRIRYEEIVVNPEYLNQFTNGDLEYLHKLKQRGPFFPKHLVAGNKIRMNEQIHITDKPMNTSYHRLTGREKLLARCVDFFYSRV